MKSRKRIITIAVLAVAGLAVIALPSFAMRGRGEARGAGRGMGPAFTDAQTEQIEKIHDKYDDDRAELTNRLKVLMVEGQEIADGGTPDFDAIEDTMEEVADIRLKLGKLRLQIHKEIRPLLDEDQKVLFDRGVGRLLQGGRGGHPGMMGGRGMHGRQSMQGGRGMGMSGPGMGGKGGRGAMGGRMQAHPGMDGGRTPWCPFADDQADDN